MLFDDGESALIVDAGLRFPDETMMGIDYVVPDFSCLGEVAERLEGVLLTHGHEDHVGAVPFLLREIALPVHGTRLTLGLLRHRLEEYGLAGEAELREIRREGSFRLGSFDVEAFPVCHSIPDAVGYILRAGGEVFVHTGDFKLDDTPRDGVPTGLARLARLAEEEGVTALFSDSTNVERDGHSLPESFVEEALEEIFRKAPGRVVTAMFSSNVHRMQAVLDAAARTGRRVALCGRSMVRNLHTALDLGYMKLPHPEILVPVERVEEMAPRTVAVLTTGSQGEPRSALTLMALGEYKNVRIRPGDTAVLSSKFIPGNERAIFSVIDHLSLAGAEVLYETISEVHVSGHASRDELRRMIETVRPAHFVPVHGEPRLLIRHRRLAEEAGVASTFTLLNGDSIVFDGKGARKEEGEPPGRLFVDGKGMGDVEGFVLRDRRQLSQVGVVMVVMAVSSSTGEVLYGPDVVARGVVTETGDEELLEGARLAALDEWEATGVEARKDYAEFKDGLRRALRRYFNRRIERKPVILPVLLEL